MNIGVAANGLASANVVPVNVFTGPKPAQLSPAAAKPGASITIDGELLDPPGRVLFDGAPVSFDSWTAKAVTFKIPNQHPDGSPWKPDQDVDVKLTSDGVASANSLRLKVL